MSRPEGQEKLKARREDVNPAAQFTMPVLQGAAMVNWFVALLILISFPLLLCAQAKPRARDVGVPFDGAPGPLNAITDVAGVEVGHRTLISGEGKLVVGQGPVRTGVTAVLPRGRSSQDPVFAAWFTENGNGEMTGTTWVEESGFLEGPVMITNTHSVGTVRDAVIAWRIQRGLVWSAANQTAGAEMGSIIVVLATDAPLLPHQLKRLAKRIPLGLARNGSVAGNGSGDIFIAFSTANAGAAKEKGMSNINFLPNAQMGALFEATVQATEEAVINALVAAETMTGIDGHKVIALPHDRMREVLQRHNLLTK